MYLINNVLSQSVYILGLIVLIGLLIQKEKGSKILPSVIKTMIGYLMLNSATQYLSGLLQPFQKILVKIFNMDFVVQDPGTATVSSYADVATEMSLIFIIGFFVHLVIARVTKFKYVHLSVHVAFFYSGLIAALLKFGTGLGFVPLITIGAIILGIYLTFACTITAPLMQNIKGGEGIALGHSSSCVAWASAKLGKIFGNKDNDVEKIKFPKGLNFLKEVTVSLALVMVLLYLIVCLIAGPKWVQTEISGGMDFVTYSISCGLQIGLWITVMNMGIRMLLAELVPAFHGVAEKLIPNAMPGLDIPVLFPNHSNCIILGFVVCLISGLVGMVILSAVGYPVVVFPILIQTFFCGASAAIFGNSTGGVRGAVIGAWLAGVVLIFGQAFLLPCIGTFAPVIRVLGDADYCFYGPILGNLLKVLGGI